MVSGNTSSTTSHFSGDGWQKVLISGTPHWQNATSLHWNAVMWRTTWSTELKPILSRNFSYSLGPQFLLSDLLFFIPLTFGLLRFDPTDGSPPSVWSCLKPLETAWNRLKPSQRPCKYHASRATPVQISHFLRATTHRKYYPLSAQNAPSPRRG